MPELEVQDATKRYGATLAVDRVSFRARPGRLLGLLGPNGAGKSSTLRMIAAITAPDRGRVTWDGRDVGPASQERMGYLPEERGLYRKMKVGEQLAYFGQLKGLSRAAAAAAARRWLERLDAAAWLSKRTDELSKGMQQKVQFVATVLHDPDLVVLDEPFSGLDPLNGALLRDIVLEMREAGKTVVFASHRMEQVEQLCDDVCLIAAGRVVLAGALADVKRRFARDAVTLDWRGSGAWLEGLVREGAVRVLKRREGHAELQLLDGTPSKTVLDHARFGVDELLRFALDAPPMDEIFRRAVQGELPEPLLPPLAPSP